MYCKVPAPQLVLKGALTARAHQFEVRSWDLKTFLSVELESFEHQPVILNIKNESIIRVLPKNSAEWLTDFTRFSFKNFITNKTYPLLTPIISYRSNHATNWPQTMFFFYFFVFILRKLSLMLLLKNTFALQKTKTDFNFVTLTGSNLKWLKNTKSAALGVVIKSLLGIFYFSGYTAKNNPVASQGEPGEIIDVPQKWIQYNLPHATLGQNKNKSNNYLPRVVIPTHNFKTTLYTKMVEFHSRVSGKLNAKNNQTLLTPDLIEKFSPKKLRFLGLPQLNMSNLNGNFKGGDVTFMELDLINKQSTLDYKTFGGTNIISVHSTSRVDGMQFLPIKDRIIEGLLEKKFKSRSKFQLVVPKHLYYSYEFSVSSLEGKKKTQKYSQILLLSQMTKLKNLFFIFETLSKLFSFRQTNINHFDQLSLIFDFKHI